MSRCVSLFDLHFLPFQAAASLKVAEDDYLRQLESPRPYRRLSVDPQLRTLQQEMGPLADFS